MSKRIQELTPTQQREMQEWYSRGIKYGTSTEAADRPRAERAITAMYARLGHKAPKFMWVDGPATACLFLAFARTQNSLNTSLRDSLRDSLKDSLRDSLKDSLRDSLSDSLGGQHELYWINYYTYAMSLPLPHPPKDADKELLTWWLDIGESCGLWWPRSELVICSERPSVCKFNARRVLHCDDGPALVYRDGWKVWALDGLRLPEKNGEQIVMRPETQTIQQIDAEKNNDIRAIRLSRFGVGRYLTESGASVLDEGACEIEGTHEALMQTPNGRRFFWPTCPSGRVCPPMPVPDNINTRAEARKWLDPFGTGKTLART